MDHLSPWTLWTGECPTRLSEVTAHRSAPPAWGAQRCCSRAGHTGHWQVTLAILCPALMGRSATRLACLVQTDDPHCFPFLILFTSPQTQRCPGSRQPCMVGLPRWVMVERAEQFPSPCCFLSECSNRHLRLQGQWPQMCMFFTSGASWKWCWKTPRNRVVLLLVASPASEKARQVTHWDGSPELGACCGENVLIHVAWKGPWRTRLAIGPWRR